MQCLYYDHAIDTTPLLTHHSVFVALFHNYPLYTHSHLLIPYSHSAPRRPIRCLRSAQVDLAKVMSHQIKPVAFTYTDRDVILYALGVGAARDPLDQSELKFTYENHPNFQVSSSVNSD